MAIVSASTGASINGLKTGVWFVEWLRGKSSSESAGPGPIGPSKRRVEVPATTWCGEIMGESGESSGGGDKIGVGTNSGMVDGAPVW